MLSLTNLPLSIHQCDGEHDPNPKEPSSPVHFSSASLKPDAVVILAIFRTIPPARYHEWASVSAVVCLRASYQGRAMRRSAWLLVLRRLQVLRRAILASRN